MRSHLPPAQKKTDLGKRTQRSEGEKVGEREEDIQERRRRQPSQERRRQRRRKVGETRERR